jgi:glycosyltransferase involved in cell wall biosynthesis
MKILWLTWKDMDHPHAGGAEVVNEELAKRLVVDGHEVQFVVGGFKGGAPKVHRHGFTIVRLGNRYSVYWRALKYYKEHLQDWPELVIDEVNTVPFFAKFYVAQRNMLFVHQLARKIWFYEMWFPFSLIGYLIEPIYLWFLRDREVITVSQSTKKDLIRFGFKSEKIHIISEGIQISPLATLAGIEKYDNPTLLSLGDIRPMKRTHVVINAFELAKNDIPELQLIVAGDTDSRYGRKILKMVKRSKFKDSIQVLGSVSGEKKLELLQKSFALIVTSVKEGWGLVVTEANSQGTPAIVYNSDGLRDSVRHRQTGLVCRHNIPEELAANILNLYTIPVYYENVCSSAWEWSKEINFDNSYQQLLNAIA